MRLLDRVIAGLRYHFAELTARLFPAATKSIILRGNPFAAFRPSVELIAPINHRLQDYKDVIVFYDHFFPRLACLLDEESDDAIIDVGANIGDTVALLRLYGVNNRIFAIEPSDRYFQLMRANIARHPDLYRDVETINAFAGNPRHHLVLGEGGASAKSLIAIAQPPGKRVLTLAEIRPQNVCAVKIDTDGYDAEIILANLDWLGKNTPVLWAEAWVDNDDQLEKWQQVCKELRGDYETAMIFDNQGLPMLSLPLSDFAPDLLHALVKYSWQQRVLSGMRRRYHSIPYFDICFFAGRHGSVRNKFVDIVKQDTASLLRP